MNFKKVIAILLVLIMACATVVSCSGDKQTDVKEELTQAPTVSFNFGVRNQATKKNIIPKTDYTYCGSDFKLTTILDWYCEVENDPVEKMTFKLNEDGSIATLDTMKSGSQDGGYGYFYITLNGEIYGETKETQGLNYYDYVVKDGDEIMVYFDIASAKE